MQQSCGFVDFIEAYCREQESSQSYRDASGLFFTYVKELVAGIKLELRKKYSARIDFPPECPSCGAIFSR